MSVADASEGPRGPDSGSWDRVIQESRKNSYDLLTMTMREGSGYRGPDAGVPVLSELPDRLGNFVEWGPKTQKGSHRSSPNAWVGII